MKHRKVKVIIFAAIVLVTVLTLAAPKKSLAGGPTCTGVYFPPAGQSTSYQSTKTPVQVGLNANVVNDLKSTIRRGNWALWRDGYLVYVNGGFNRNILINSTRKTLHAATIGSLIQSGKITSVDQKLSTWDAGRTGGPNNCHAEATLAHTMGQMSAFDDQSKCPGQLWAYSDANPPQINRVAARAYRGTNSTDYTSNYSEVIGGALLNPINATGWTTSAKSDGIHLNMDVEDLGRFGILLANRGAWAGNQVVPAWYVDAMSTKKTYGVPPNYNNANDGNLLYTTADFPEAPYGYFTWVNTDRDYAPNASASWAWGAGHGGHYLFYDRESGVVLALTDSRDSFSPSDPRPGAAESVVLHALQRNITGPNPLVSCL